MTSSASDRCARDHHAVRCMPHRPRSAARWLALTLGVLACTACSSLSPPSPALLGQSLREAQTLQTRAPRAGAGSATGLDGPAARAALQRYEQSSEAPARTAPVFNIGIGASSSR